MSDLRSYPPGSRIVWEASPNGSRFVGTVAAHGPYCGRDALIILEPWAIVYPEEVLRVVGQ